MFSKFFHYSMEKKKVLMPALPAIITSNMQFVGKLLEKVVKNEIRSSLCILQMSFS